MSRLDACELEAAVRLPGGWRAAAANLLASDPRDAMRMTDGFLGADTGGRYRSVEEGSPGGDQPDKTRPTTPATVAVLSEKGRPGQQIGLGLACRGKQEWRGCQS